MSSSSNKLRSSEAQEPLAINFTSASTFLWGFPTVIARGLSWLGIRGVNERLLEALVRMQRNADDLPESGGMILVMDYFDEPTTGLVQVFIARNESIVANEGCNK